MRSQIELLGFAEVAEGEVHVAERIQRIRLVGAQLLIAAEHADGGGKVAGICGRVAHEVQRGHIVGPESEGPAEFDDGGVVVAQAISASASAR